MHRMIVFLFLLFSSALTAQELYVFSEPASNMPARSIAVKQTAKILRNQYSGATESRHTSELMWGANKNLMLHGAATFSDMYSSNLRWESARVYGKYRFLSNDDMYSHFRMSAFAEASVSRNKAMFDELSLDGDQGGIQAGIIATQLLHKLALSATVGRTEILQSSRWDKASTMVVPYSAYTYSLSAGYLVLPKKYKSYDQTNLNLYVELLGQQTTGIRKYYLDLAPAVQLIFNSTAKLNAGYRFQLGSDMKRMAANSWLLSFEWTFLNVR